MRTTARMQGTTKNKLILRFMLDRVIELMFLSEQNSRTPTIYVLSEHRVRIHPYKPFDVINKVLKRYK